MCENNIYHWETNEEIGFRRIVLDFTHSNIKEIDRFNYWNGKTRICSKCKVEYPECTYFFASGGKSKFHHYCKICECTPCFGWGRKYNYKLNEHGFQYCNKCDRILPLNELYFGITNGKCNKTGYSSNCKECTSKEKSFGLFSFNNKIKDIKKGYKLCHACYLEIPDTDDFFFKKSDKKNGSVVCKKCKGFEYGINRLNKVFKDSLPENYRYCYECRELKYIDELQNGCLCKDCAIPKRKKYNQRPEVKENKRIFSHKRRSLAKKLRSDLTQEQYHETLDYFECSCAYCDKKPENIYELQQDHIHPISKGGEYTKSNIIPSCESCNKSKNNKSIDEFFEFNNDFTKERYEKIINFIELNSEY